MPRSTGLDGAYRRLFYATAITSNGDGAATVAAALLALTLTKNPIAVAAVTATGQVAGTVVSLPAGLWTDRYDPGMLMRRAAFIAAAATAILSAVILIGVVSLWWLYLTVTVVAACDMVWSVAMQSQVPALVTPTNFVRASGQIFGIEATGEQLIGPGLGGLVFAVARYVPFLGDAVTFVAAGALVPTAVPQPGRSGGDKAVISASRRQELLAGWSAFRNNRQVLVLSSTVAAVAGGQAAVFAIMVLYGRHQLHLGAAGYGLFMTGAAVLGVIASFAAPHWCHFRRNQLVLAFSGTAVALSYVGLALLHRAWIAAPVFGLQECGTVILNINSVALRRRIVPAQVYGRVTAVHKLLVKSVTPIGAIVGGVLAGAIGVPGLLICTGAALIFLVWFALIALHVAGPGQIAFVDQTLQQAATN